MILEFPVVVAVVPDKFSGGNGFLSCVGLYWVKASTVVARETTSSTSSRALAPASAVTFQRLIDRHFSASLTDRHFSASCCPH